MIESNDITLNCDNKQILGGFTETGIRLNDVSNVTLNNCDIENNLLGIDLYDSDNIYINNLSTDSNTTGVSITSSDKIFLNGISMNKDMHAISINSSGSTEIRNMDIVLRSTNPVAPAIGIEHFDSGDLLIDTLSALAVDSVQTIINSYSNSSSINISNVDIETFDPNLDTPISLSGGASSAILSDISIKNARTSSIALGRITNATLNNITLTRDLSIVGQTAGILVISNRAGDVITIQNADISNHRYAILLNDGKNTTITDSNLHDNMYGVYLKSPFTESTNNVIKNTNFGTHSNDSVYIYDNSVSNTKFYGNSFLSTTEIRWRISSPSNNNYFSEMTPEGLVGNFWNTGCSSSETRGSYEVCTSPSSVNIRTGPTVSDTAPLASWSAIK